MTCHFSPGSDAWFEKTKKLSRKGSKRKYIARTVRQHKKRNMRGNHKGIAILFNFITGRVQ